ncbi:DDT domain-containing protein DDR4 [Morus notabilis]|uniref:DDT domain-containing protein DDR4 n=1 Tax=Morus notabilis TaxID=981085 RepID=UPI000CECFCAB|nr:DDT domain-containing protein DDR4 [Morus notabilis]
MAVGRRTCDEPSASDSDGGEAKSQPPEKKADVVVVSDDGERGEEDRLKAEVKELRGRWELASVLNFLTVFQPVIGKDLRISAEEIETGLVNPDNSLAQLHITLLKGIPPASKTLDGSDAWVTVLRRKLSHWWSWVAEGEIPLMAAKGEETSEYKGLDPKRRLLILKALCEIRADQDDTVAYIKDSLKQGTQISSFRKENIGGNGNGTSFWYEGNTIIGHRLYRGVTTFGTKTKSRGKKCLDPPSFQWETLATDLEEFRKLADEFSSSEVVAEVAVGKTIKTDAIPALEKIQKNRESAMKRKQMQERVLNDCRSSSTRVTRSCRNRRPVNYTYDNYDRAIWEAIERTSDPERKTDSDDDLPKRDCAGDASSGKKDDAMDIDLVQEVDTDDDDYDCSSKGDVDDSDFSDSGKPELDVKNKNAGCDAPKHFGSRWSLRLAGFTNESFVENRYLGTKNRSRQRPVHNSALDAVVIRDSEDDS